MSILLKDAIVDAKSLREAALKTAETTVIDKYSEEVRSTLEKLLEQEEDLGLDLGAPADLGAPPEAGMDAGAGEEGTGEDIAPDVPLAATDGLSENEGENLNHLLDPGEDVEVNINLDALQEAIDTMKNEQEFELNEAALTALLDEAGQPGTGSGQALAGSAAATAADTAALEDEEGEEEESPQDPGSFAGQETGLGEDLDLSDELIDEIVERLTVDMGATLSGWAGRSSESQKYEMERELAHRRSTDMEDDLKDLRKAWDELVFENKQLEQSLDQYKQATNELRENLQDVNLSNARLLYTNRVLRNTSLNERQKTKIADAISKAGSVTEAKTIYQTLESAVETTKKSGPQSLSEAIGRRSTSVIRASREESTPSDPATERMKKLAGIT